MFLSKEVSLLSKYLPGSSVMSETWSPLLKTCLFFRAVAT
jgi:hypothetical protein